MHRQKGVKNKNNKKKLSDVYENMSKAKGFARCLYADVDCTQ